MSAYFHRNVGKGILRTTNLTYERGLVAGNAQINDSEKCQLNEFRISDAQTVFSSATPSRIANDNRRPLFVFRNRHSEMYINGRFIITNCQSTERTECRASRTGLDAFAGSLGPVESSLA